MQIIWEKNKWNQMAEMISRMMELKEEKRRKKLEEEWKDRGLKTQEYWAERDKKKAVREDEEQLRADNEKAKYNQDVNEFSEMPEYLDSPEMPSGLEAFGVQGGSFVPEAFENEDRKRKGMGILQRQVAKSPDRWSKDEITSASSFWGDTGRGRERKIAEAAETKRREEQEKRDRAMSDQKEIISHREAEFRKRPRNAPRVYESSDVKDLRSQISDQRGLVAKSDSEIADFKPSDRFEATPTEDPRFARLENLRNQRAMKLANLEKKLAAKGTSSAVEVADDTEPDNDVDDYAAFKAGFDRLANGG